MLFISNLHFCALQGRVSVKRWSVLITPMLLCKSRHPYTTVERCFMITMCWSKIWLNTHCSMNWKIQYIDQEEIHDRTYHSTKKEAILVVPLVKSESILSSIEDIK